MKGLRETAALGALTLAMVSTGARAQQVPAGPPSAADAQTGQETVAAPQATSDPSTEQPTDEVVVTAQKRAENVQDVPISIVAVGSEQLRQAGVDDVLEITKLVPSFTSTRQNSPSGIRLNIRGVGATTQTSVEPSVASFLDDVYVSRPGSLFGRFYDVDSIEVLRGPQGTLFGRNASVGAISIHTRKPTQEFEGYAEGQYASFDSYEATGAVNVPITDTLAVRAAGLYTHTDGPWYTTVNRDHYGAINSAGGRLTIRFRPTSSIDWIVRGDYLKNTGDGSGHNTIKTDTVTPQARANFTARLGGVAPDFDHQFSRTSNNYVVGDLNDHQYGITSDFSFSFGEGYALRLIDAYRDWSSRHYVGDLAYTPRPIFIRDETQASAAQSHELQITSPTDLFGHLGFVGGLYYFRENLRFNEAFDFSADTCNYVIRYAAPTLLAGCLAGPFQDATANDFDQILNSYAAYGQGTVTVGKIDLTLGGRYTRDEKKGSFVQLVNNPAGLALRARENSQLEFDDGRFTWRANLSYHPTDDVMLFANYSTGFKSGGFNSGGGTPALGSRRIFGSETTKDYEGGFRSQWLDHALTFNVTAYRMVIDNFQDRSFDGTSFIVRNAAKLRQQGVEGELLLRPSSAFRFNAALSYLDSKFLSYPGASGLPGFGGTQDLTGQRNNFSPEFQGAVGAQYDARLGSGGWNASLRGDISFVSDQSVSSITDGNPQGVQDGYSLVSTRLTVRSPGDRYSVAVFAENLFDKGYCTFIFPNTLDSVFGLRNTTTGGTLQRCAVGTPRQIGVRVSAKF